MRPIFKNFCLLQSLYNQILLETQVAFKMERFMKVAPKITAAGLENTEVDKRMTEAHEEAKKRAENPKHFIQQNLKFVKDL